MPPHKLQRLTAHFISRDKDLLEFFPLGCAERIAVVDSSAGLFSGQRHGRSPELPRLLQHALSGPDLVQFLPLHRSFWTIELKRVWRGRNPRIQRQVILHHNAIVVELEEGYVNGDISFMTSLKLVWARELA